MLIAPQLKAAVRLLLGSVRTSLGKPHQPSRAKGRRYPVEISAVAWMDLLGYGSMLRDVAFDPSHPQAQAAVDRLKQFQRIAASFATKHFPAMPINDATAFFHDLTPRTNAVTYEFLTRSIQVFEKVNKVELSQGHPGARMIIAVGPRMRISGVAMGDLGHKKSIFERVQNGIITTEQAIHEAFRSGPIAGFVPQLQANFAFTKAYLADEMGSKVGLGGANCYIDLCIFSEKPPDWVRFRRTQPWSSRGMSTTFGEFDSLDRLKAQQTRFEGLLNAIEIADSLSIAY
jgi:hypothetical protein